MFRCFFNAEPNTLYVVFCLHKNQHGANFMGRSGCKRALDSQWMNRESLDNRHLSVESAVGAFPKAQLRTKRSGVRIPSGVPKFKRIGARTGQTIENQRFVLFSIWETKKVGAVRTM